ncbi:hypothetical protein H6B13_03630 [Bacteroides gallinaceum]|nr:hypothetical protein [Bacteroides gallinaceum]MBM6718735.1 hypothetical protein [Bacteroides gallinaceum]
MPPETKIWATCKAKCPYRYAIKCKDDVRTIPTKMAWDMQEMHKSIPRKA